MLVAPIINFFIDSGSPHRHLYIVLVACFFNFYMGFLTQQEGYVSGFCLPNFICVYVIANYCRRYNFQMRFPGLAFISLVLINAAVKYFLCRHEDYAYLGLVDYYNSPTIIAASFCLGLLISKTRMYYFEKNKKVIIFLSSSAFSVYLISNHPYFRDVIYPIMWNYIYNDISSCSVLLYVIYAIITNALIFVLCIIIDKMRVSIEDLVISWKNRY